MMYMHRIGCEDIVMLMVKWNSVEFKMVYSKYMCHQRYVIYKYISENYKFSYDV